MKKKGVRVSLDLMIQLFSVSKTYPSQITVLSDFYLEVLSGEFVFIAGPSGSGKSTLLRLLFGAERPTRGEIIVNGIRLSQPHYKKVYQLRKTMGIISSDVRLLKDRNVKENVAFALEVLGYPARAIREKVSERLDQLELRERAEDSILSLSAGEQQRVAIARAVVRDPTLILADDPTHLLDEEMTEKVMALFVDLYQKGTTIVLATQDANLIGRHPYRVVTLHAGRSGDGESREGVIAEG